MSLQVLVDAALAVEKLRVAAQVRQSHLVRNGNSDPDTDRLVERLQGLESWVDGEVAVIIKTHPAYPWFSRVKGVGKENIGKVVSQVRVKPERGLVKVKGEDVNDTLEERDLPYADTISALWQYAGFGVENGKAPKRKAGEKTAYNAELRTMCWRLGGSLMKAGGCFKTYYDEQKARYVELMTNEGKRIVPAAQLPKVDGKRQENGEVISEGHVHAMALRKMLKLFLSCLFLAWREAEGLPATVPYAIGQMGHNHAISPWDMVDR